MFLFLLPEGGKQRGGAQFSASWKSGRSEPDYTRTRRNVTCTLTMCTGGEKGGGTEGGVQKTEDLISEKA